MGGKGAGWALRADGISSGAGREGGSGVGRAGGREAWRDVGRAGGGCLPEGLGEVVTGTRRGLGPSVEPLPGSGQGREVEGRGRGSEPTLAPIAPGHWGPQPLPPETLLLSHPCFEREDSTMAILPPSLNSPLCPSTSVPPAPSLYLCSPHPCICPHLISRPFPLVQTPSPPAPLPPTPGEGELCRVWGQQQRKHWWQPGREGGHRTSCPAGRRGGGKGREREHSSGGGRRRLDGAASEPPAPQGPTVQLPLGKRDTSTDGCRARGWWLWKALGEGRRAGAKDGH